MESTTSLNPVPLSVDRVVAAQATAFASVANALEIGLLLARNAEGVEYPISGDGLARLKADLQESACELDTWPQHDSLAYGR